MDGMMVNKYKKVKYTLGASCNEEMTREKSIKKKVKCK